MSAGIDGVGSAIVPMAVTVFDDLVNTLAFIAKSSQFAKNCVSDNFVAFKAGYTSALTTGVFTVFGAIISGAAALHFSALKEIPTSQTKSPEPAASQQIVQQSDINR